MSTVSVIIPAYNAEKFIRAAVDSVLAQTAPPLELLVIDDGSRDRTADIVASYGGIVRLVRQANGGPARARNHGVELASGEYIAFLDADDAWRADKLQKQVRAMQEQPDAVLCYTGKRLLMADGSEKIEVGPPPENLVDILRVYNPGIPPSAVLMRRSAFLTSGGFDVLQKGCEDWDLWFRLSRMGPFCMVRQPLTVYVAADTGLSSNADLMFADFERMLDRLLLKDLHGMKRTIWRRKILAYQTYKAALTARGAGEFRKEWEYFKRSSRLWPSPLWYPDRFKAMLVALIRRES